MNNQKENQYLTTIFEKNQELDGLSNQLNQLNDIVKEQTKMLEDAKTKINELEGIKETESPKMKNYNGEGA